MSCPEIVQLFVSNCCIASGNGPAELLVVLGKSNRLIKKNYYPKTR